MVLPVLPPRADPGLHAGEYRRVTGGQSAQEMVRATQEHAKEILKQLQSVDNGVTDARKDRSIRTKGLAMLMVIVMSRKARTKMVENWVADHNGAGILLGTKRAMICDGSTALS
jgi:hypothetical protein